jgi:hypothetical protein
VRVINSGVGGYNTVQEVTYFKQEGVTFQPDLVMLTYVQNDIEDYNVHFDPSTIGAPRGKSLPDMVITMLGKLWFYRLADHTYRYGLPKQRKGQSSKPSQGGEGWSHSMSALGELAAMCEEHHIPLIVFFDRSPGENNPLLEDVVRHVRGPVRIRDNG